MSTKMPHLYDNMFLIKSQGKKEPLNGQVEFEEIPKITDDMVAVREKEE